MDTNGELDLTYLENLDHILREKWVVTIAMIFITMRPAEVLNLIVAGGFPKFLSLASEQFGQHSLRDEDYKAIFERLEAEDQRRQSVHYRPGVH